MFGKNEFEESNISNFRQYNDLLQKQYLKFGMNIINFSFMSLGVNTLVMNMMFMNQNFMVFESVVIILDDNDFTYQIKENMVSIPK